MKVKGKSILWLSLIAALLTTLLTIDVSTAPTPAKLSIEPPRIPVRPSQFGLPSDEYQMSVTIDNAENVWAVSFIVDYAPYGRPLFVNEVFEGPFMTQPGYDTYFTYTINMFRGELKVGITRLVTPGKPVVGASGSGILCTFKFTVTEAGDSDIDLTDVGLYGIVPIDDTYDLEQLPYITFGSSYHGCTADLITAWIEGGRVHHVGESLVINSKARNDCPVTLMARTRFDIERFEDGRRIRMYSGQNYAGGGLGEPNPSETFYLSGYIGGMEDGSWGLGHGGLPLMGDYDANYLECTTIDGITGLYTFPQINLGDREMLNWDLYGYTRQPDGSTDWDIDPYLFFYDAGGNYLGLAWCDSFGGSATGAWTGGRYYQGGPYDMPEYYMSSLGIPHTEEIFNNMKLLIQNYCPSGPRQQIDAVKLVVEYSSITPVNPEPVPLPPFSEVDMPPATWNEITEGMIGEYIITATLEYTLTGNYWVEGDKTKTMKVTILP